MLEAAFKAPVLRSIYRPEGEGRAERILECLHLYKAESAETGGMFSCFEAVIPPGAAVPRHVHHDEDEALYGLSGELTIEMEGIGKPVSLRRGGFCFSPQGRWHAFRNDGTMAAHVLVIVTPGDSVERMFRDLSKACADSQGIPPVRQLAGIMNEHSISLVPDVF
jgi:mannose-6-phosphate isomerase-like protein (cupin superfamily)